jgi:hypothetical protein
VRAQNTALKEGFAALRTRHRGLHYLGTAALIGNDHEGTLDGTHLTDLGSSRMFEALKAKITSIQGSKRKKRKADRLERRSSKIDQVVP